ncbi:MAG: NUDIX hydrolase [Clostridia bacterium]|nr:NUDIX hydrolase [Clostridia bacterium]
MDLTEKTVSQQYIFEGRILKMRVDEALLPDGTTAGREVVEHPGGVCVAALTDDDCLLFVRQFRYPYGEVLSEIPAGKRDPGETPLETGKRELKEETGYTARNYISLGRVYPSPGYFNEVIYMYLATDLVAGDVSPDEDEFLEVEKIPLHTAVDMVMNDEITDAKTQAAVMKVWFLRQNGEI